MQATSARARGDWGSIFRSTDDGAGGRWATWTRAVKFYGRLVLRWPSVERCITSMHQLGIDLGAHYSIEISLRPMRPYLCRGFTVASRARCVLSHFHWLHTTLRPEVSRSLCQHHSVSIPLDVAGCPGVELMLRQSASQSREGELSLDLYHQQRRLMSATFSVVDGRAAALHPGTPSTMLVAGFQGVRGTEQEMRELGASLQKLRPSALLICALQGLCAGWQLPAPLAVSRQCHVYASYARKRSIQLDYDSIWSEAGSDRIASSYWQLPASPLIRTDDQVPSKHRAQHRRRSALKLTFFDACRAAALSMSTRVAREPE